MRSLQRMMVRMLWVVAVLVLAACSTTEIVGTWTDPEFTGKRIDSLLVIARVEDESLRRMFEDRFASALQDRGVNAVASYRVFPAMAELDKAGVEERAQKLGLRGVLIARLLETEKVEIQEPGYGPGYGPGFAPYRHPYRDSFYRWPDYYRSWHSYYGYGYGYPYAPTWTREATVFRLETNLYDTASDRLVWSARSETTTFESPEKKLDEVVREIIGKLEGSGLI